MVSRLAGIRRSSGSVALAELLAGAATGLAVAAGLPTLTVPLPAGLAGQASGLGSAVGALLSVGTSFFIDAVAGINTNPGTIGAPWRDGSKITAANVPTGSSVFFRRGQQHLVTATINIPFDNITIDAYGSGANPVFYGWEDIKGTTGDWTQGNTNIWSRVKPVSIQNRYRMKVDDIIYTHNQFNPPVDSNALGKWGIVQSGTAPTFLTSRLYLYSVGNPATVYSTIEISSPLDAVIRAETKKNCTYKNFDITGFRGALWPSNDGLLIEDVSIYGCARRAFQLWGPGTCVLRRVQAYKCGFHQVGHGAPGGAHGIIFTGVNNMEVHATIDGFRVWECGEDNIQLGGTMSLTSTIILDGRNWWSFCALAWENPLDVKDAHFDLIHCELHSSTESGITMQGKAGTGRVIDCCVSNVKTLFGLLIQEARSQLILDHSMIYAAANCAADIAWSGSRHRMLSSVLIGHGSTNTGGVFVRHGELDVVHSTLALHTAAAAPGLFINRAIWPVNGLGPVTKTSGPDGEGNLTYQAIVSQLGTLRSWGEQSLYEFTGLTGASAGLNNFTITMFGVSESQLICSFKVPASLGTPNTIDLTGGTLWSIPRLRTFIGAALSGGNKVLRVESLKSLPDASYGAAYVKDRVTTSEVHAATTFDGTTEVSYTAAQLKAALGVGSLIVNTGGKIGGPANRTDYVATEALRWMNVTSIVVTDGIAVVNFATPHQFAGDKVCIKGSTCLGGTPAIMWTPATALDGCKFFRENSATQIEFNAFPWVIDQTATGTITATDGQLIAGSAGLGTHVQTNVAVQGVATDFHGKAFPAVGAAGNFGAIAP